MNASDIDKVPDTFFYPCRSKILQRHRFEPSFRPTNSASLITERAKETVPKAWEGKLL